jgi:hypothetical protein
MLVLLASCQQQPRTNLNYEMGERVEIGPFTYVVVESAWRSELGEGFQVRAAKNRFLILTLAVTNGGGSDTSVPMLSAESSNGQAYQELSDGTGLANWLGVLRTVKPAETLQGRIIFDVPLSAFRLRLPDGGESGYEKFAWVNVPLSMSAGEVQSALPGSTTK